MLENISAEKSQILKKEDKLNVPSKIKAGLVGEKQNLRACACAARARESKQVKITS